MSQRSLDEEDPPEEASPEPEEDETPDATEEGSESLEPAELPRGDRPTPQVPRGLVEGPSDTALRERQIAWMRERARHEERRRPGDVAEGSK